MIEGNTNIIAVVDLAVIEDPQDPEVLTADTETEEVAVVGADQVQVRAVGVRGALTVDIEKNHRVQEVNKNKQYYSKNNKFR